MDISKKDLKKKRNYRKQALIAGPVLGLVLITIFILRLSDAAPRMDSNTAWVETVRQGPLEVSVRGMGTLVPESIRWITASSTAQVKDIILLPGAIVEPDTIILELENAELEQSLAQAELELAAARARLANARATEEDRILELEFELARLQSSFASAELDVRVNEGLFEEGLVAERDLLRSQLNERQLKTQTDILQRRFKQRQEQMDQNLAPAQASVEQQLEQVALLTSRVDELKVRAGLAGVLQRLPVEVGQQLTIGAQIAQVADPSKLKAAVRIPETQAKDVKIGLTAQIDTRNGIVQGTVARVNPTVQAGTVEIDVQLESKLPSGARADLTVEGTILLDDIPSAVYMARPSFGREFSEARIFKMVSDSAAERVNVSFGRMSVSSIQVLSGLQPGDRVILSDTSRYDDAERLILN